MEYILWFPAFIIELKKYKKSFYGYIWNRAKQKQKRKKDKSHKEETGNALKFKPGYITGLKTIIVA